MDKTRPVCADFFCKQLAAGGNGKDRALSCVCPTCAQDGDANFDLLGTILSEVQSVCSPSQLSRVEQAQFALGTIVRPHYETGEFQRHLLRKCDGSSHYLHQRLSYDHRLRMVDKISLISIVFVGRT